MTADPNALTLTDLTSPDEEPELLRAAFDAVLRPSFTAEELSGPEAAEPSQHRVVSIASTSSGEPAGVAVSAVDPTGVSLLSYLAVGPASRGLGVGSALLRHLRQLWAEAGCGVVLAEVHDPRGHADTPGEHPLARLRFYQRAGARVLDLPFVQPALARGTTRVPDMLLLVMHPSHVDAVSSTAVADWIRRYYLDAEDAVPTDPQGLELLARAGTSETIAVLPLEHWRDVTPLGT